MHAVEAAAVEQDRPPRAQLDEMEIAGRQQHALPAATSPKNTSLVRSLKCAPDRSA